MLRELITLVVAPLFVGIAVQLFAYWLDKRDGN